MSVVPVGTGATPVYTGAAGRSVRSLSFDAATSVLVVVMSDGTQESVPLPIGASGGLETGDPATTIPVSQDVIDYVTARLAPVLQTDGAQDGLLGGHTDALAAQASSLAAQIARLDAIADGVLDLSDVATDAELAAAVAAIGISSYLKSADAATLYAVKAHSHTFEGVTGLTARLADIDSAISAASGVDMSGYATQAQVTAAVAPYLKSADASNQYAVRLHGHAISDVDGLASELNSRFIAPATGTTGHVLAWNGSGLALTAPASGDLSTYLLKTDAANTYLPKVAGTTGQVLKHNGTAWAAEAQYAITDAKGDLIVGSAPDVAVRLPVGPNGQVLTADSAQASGVKWAVPAPASPPQTVTYGMPGAVSVKTGAGRWYNDLGARTLTKIRLAVGAAPTGSVLTVQVMINGVAAGTASIAAGSQAAVTTLSVALADGAYLTVNVTAVGSTTPGSDLVVNLTHQGA